MVRATFRMRSCALGGEAQEADCRFQGALSGIIEGADLANHTGGNPGIVEPARLLHGSGVLHAQSDFGGGFTRGLAAKLLVRHRGNFHVNIDAVRERAADLAEILLDLSRRAAAFLGGVPQKGWRPPESHDGRG